MSFDARSACIHENTSRRGRLTFSISLQKIGVAFCLAMFVSAVLPRSAAQAQVINHVSTGPTGSGGNILFPSGGTGGNGSDFNIVSPATTIAPPPGTSAVTVSTTGGKGGDGAAGAVFFNGGNGGQGGNGGGPNGASFVTTGPVSITTSGANAYWSAP